MYIKVHTKYERSVGTLAAIDELTGHADYDEEPQLALGVLLAAWVADRADAEACIDDLRTHIEADRAGAVARVAKYVEQADDIARMSRTADKLEKKAQAWDRVLEAQALCTGEGGQISFNSSVYANMIFEIIAEYRAETETE